MTDRPHAVLSGLAGIRADLEDLYRDLHSHPELGLREHRTAKRASDALRDCGYEVTERVGGTGVIGVLANGDGPTVMARADMDALPVRERTGLPYASTVTLTGSDGSEQPVMHACGHDVHVTALVGCARLMAAAKDAWRGTFVVLFQPSEENGDGADAMIDDGLTTKSPYPTWYSPSTSCPVRPATSAPVRGPSCRRRTASASPSTDEGGTAPCPSRRWTRW